MDKKNLRAFPTLSKQDRLLERARIVAENFHDIEIGLHLIDYLLIKMQNAMSEESWENDQFCARISEARSFLEYFTDNEGEDE